MASVYARARSKEAPMTGIEFTNRASTTPVWRANSGNMDVNAGSNAGQCCTSMKRTHSIANPPASPFDPQKENETAPKPIFGEGLRYLFRPPSTSAAFSGSSSSVLTPHVSAPQEIQDVDMRDAELSSPPKARVGSKVDVGDGLMQRMERGRGQSCFENDERGRNESKGGADKENESPERRIISNAAVRRIARRQMRGRSYRGPRAIPPRLGDLHEGAEEYEDDEDYSGEDDEYAISSMGKGKNRPTYNTSNHYTLNMPGPAQPKNDTPYVLLGYVQVIFNLSLILLFLYLLVQFIFTVQKDVEHRIGEYSADILQEITTCAQLYVTNLCATSPIPAMLHQCATWETCMSRDPKVVGRAKVGAEMLAEVVNGFVEPISWKTLIFTLSSLSFMTVFVNGLVMLYRARLHPSANPIPSSDTQANNSNENQRHQPFQHFQPAHLPSPHLFHPAYGYLPANGGIHQQRQTQLGMPMSWRAENNEDDSETMPRQRRRLGSGVGREEKKR